MFERLLCAELPVVDVNAISLTLSVFAGVVHTCTVILASGRLKLTLPSTYPSQDPPMYELLSVQLTPDQVVLVITGCNRHADARLLCAAATNSLRIVINVFA